MRPVSLLHLVRAPAFKRAQPGFTLVELMIVVAVISLLMVIAVPSFVRARETALNNRFVADLRVARDAFVQYSIDRGIYPPDTNPGIVPVGMADYLRRVPWTQRTTLGGQWDWDNGQFGFKAGVSLYRPTASRDVMENIDALIDDGDLGEGSFRERSSGFISIIEE